jgi:ActR/RegA family two-component response regulator
MDRQRILVVDDDDTWLRTIELILGGVYDLKLTTEPTEAVSLVKSSPFALAILDQRISADISGVDLLRQLREVRQDLRAIILTGFAELEDAVESMKGGADDYISKGLSNLESELRSRVKKVLAKAPPEEHVSILIQKGESAGLEFKSSVRWDLRQHKVNKDLEKATVKTVAAFLNSELGGILLIGVDDSGNAVGLQHDYETLKKRDRDGFRTFLVDIMLGAYGKDIAPLIRIDFHDVSGKDVCRISAKPSPRAVWVSDGTGQEHLYIRAEGSTHQLDGKETAEYTKARWK